MGRRGVDPRGSWEDDPSRQRSDGGPGHQPPPDPRYPSRPGPGRGVDSGNPGPAGGPNPGPGYDPRYAGQYGQPQPPRGPQYGQPPQGQGPQGQGPQGQPPQGQPPMGQPPQGAPVHGQQPQPTRTTYGSPQPQPGQPQPSQPQPRYEQPRRDQYPDPRQQPPRIEPRPDGSSAPPPSTPRPPAESVPEPRGESRAQARSAVKKKPGNGATYSVAVMTVAALVGVGVLAAQAAATAPTVTPTAKAKSSSHAAASAQANNQASAPADPAALPANSGTGARIVYGVGAKRVWLVGSSNSVARTFTIVPGTVAAPTGSFAVTNKLSAETGTDGTPVQYVVLFNKATVGGHSTAFGFDAVANVTGLPSAPTTRTGGIRMAQADAQALWNFASLDTTVVVVP